MRVRKPLKSGQNWFLRPFSSLIGGIIVLKVVIVLSIGSTISESEENATLENERDLFLTWILKALCNIQKSEVPPQNFFFLTRLPDPCGMNRIQNRFHIISINDYSNTDNNLFQEFHKRLFLCPPGLLVRESQEEVEIDIGVTSPTSVVTGGPWKFG